MSIEFSLKIRLFSQVVRKSGRFSRETPSPAVPTVFFALPGGILRRRAFDGGGPPGAGQRGRKMPDYVVIATWPFGQTAVKAAAALLADGKPALDAALAGRRPWRTIPTVHSVGYGGLGNAVGTVQLDACVMDGKDADVRRRGRPGKRASRGRGGPAGDGKNAARAAGRRGRQAVRRARGLSAGDAVDAGERGGVGEEAAQTASAGDAAGRAAGQSRHRDGAGPGQNGLAGRRLHDLGAGPQAAGPRGRFAADRGGPVRGRHGRRGRRHRRRRGDHPRSAAVI